MILLDILPKGESVNADRYCETLDWLIHAVRHKRPGPLCSIVVLQHNNATPHTAKRTKEWLECYRWDIIPHPAHSPDLAPLDFHLFGPLKSYPGGKKFENEDVLIVKDSREEVVELSEEKKKEIQQKENRVSHQNHRASYSPRKERALKIYTDEESTSSKNSFKISL
ncbi:histone-lysine N-methyltransferase SETMAR [Plakobranchus ocellatus]|uniref:Histone-lysine N-methyltransferase SETMAR n=1 Tax=Plakobranchus ocellatus TaxID=259542 RepID=A0AAV4AVD6_9GAST|nr:histone-lysine N-methyltransferase SETMAR [Plakobranchus ocellatus]